MGNRPVLRASCVAILLLAAGCHLPGESNPEPLRTGPAPGTLVPLTDITVARAVAPTVPPPARAPSVPPPLPAMKAADALTSTAPPLATPAPLAPVTAKAVEAPLPPPDDLQPEWVAAGTLLASGPRSARRRAPILVRDDEPPLAPPTTLPPITEAPGTLPMRPAPPPHTPTAAPALPVAVKDVPPGEYLPAIPAVPDAPLPAPAKPKARPAAPTTDSPPAQLPPITVAPSAPPPPPAAGLIDLNGKPVPFDTLSKLVDNNSCSSCGGSVGPSGCSSCGDRPCRPGGRGCEPFPATNAAGRVIGLIYSSVCCPDPCYQPRWEPLADTSFFTDAVRPKTSTRFRWDYGNHYAYPDRGEFFFARGDGNGKGPKPNALVKAIPYVDYHELMLVTEVAMGNAGVQIAAPYRSVNSTPFGADGAGFSDLTITAKTLLLDSELALFGFQMRTYIPVGVPAKGLGTGHVSLEPGLNFGLRASPETYLQAQVVEWIPLGGDKDYQGAHLRWAASINHVWWRPIRDVQLIGTLETTGISFQDGLFTDPAFGTTRLAKRTSAAIGPGMRLFFCDTFDIGVGWQHAMTGKYLMRDFVRFEARYRY